MKAVRIHRFGGPEVLQLDQVDVPEPGPGEVRVRVAAASVNPVDYKIREGEFPRIREGDLPTTLGRDVCGVVDAVGPGVDHVVPGEAVFAFLGWGRGGYAEQAIAKLSEFAAKPQSLTVIEAASLPLAGLTAWQGLFDHGELKAGERVLIHGASGGVGYLAVQFAHAHGAEVIATCSEANMEWVASLGAAKVIDYKAQRFEDDVEGVDLVLDLVGGDIRARSWTVIKPQGRLVTALRPGDAAAEGLRHDRKGSLFMAEPNADQLRSIADMADEGGLQVMIDRTFALEDAAAAQIHLREGHPRGKVVLEVR